MTLKAILAALALGTAAANAGAAVLTFDGLTGMMMGDGFPLAAGMHYEGTNLVYEESGYRVTLNAPGADAGAAHVGDGTFDPQTFNWHDGMENGAHTYVTLTRADGSRSMCASSQIGHVTSARSCCRANSSPEANQPSKRCPCAQPSSKMIMSVKRLPSRAR